MDGNSEDNLYDAAVLVCRQGSLSSDKQAADEVAPPPPPAPPAAGRKKWGRPAAPPAALVSAATDEDPISPCFELPAVLSSPREEVQAAAAPAAAPRKNWGRPAPLPAAPAFAEAEPQQPEAEVAEDSPTTEGLLPETSVSSATAFFTPAASESCDEGCFFEDHHHHHHHHHHQQQQQQQQQQEEEEEPAAEGAFASDEEQEGPRHTMLARFPFSDPGVILDDESETLVYASPHNSDNPRVRVVSLQALWRDADDNTISIPVIKKTLYTGAHPAILEQGSNELRIHVERLSKKLCKTIGFATMLGAVVDGAKVELIYENAGRSLQDCYPEAILPAGQRLEAIPPAESWHGLEMHKRLMLVCRDAPKIIKILANMHRRGIVHRDIKPANIARQFHEDPSTGTITDWTVKFLDLGTTYMAQPLRSRRRNAQGDFGLESAAEGLTAEYTAPERWYAQGDVPAYMFDPPLRGPAKYYDIAPSADVWAVGATLWECLTGMLAFDGGWYDRQAAGGVDPSEDESRYQAACRATFQLRPFMHPFWPQGLRDLLKGMLQLDPRRRLTARQCLMHPWVREMTRRQYDADFAAACEAKEDARIDALLVDYGQSEAALSEEPSAATDETLLGSEQGSRGATTAGAPAVTASAADEVEVTGAADETERVDEFEGSPAVSGYLSVPLVALPDETSSDGSSTGLLLTDNTDPISPQSSDGTAGGTCEAAPVAPFTSRRPSSSTQLAPTAPTPSDAAVAALAAFGVARATAAIGAAFAAFALSAAVVSARPPVSPHQLATPADQPRSSGSTSISAVEAEEDASIQQQRPVEAASSSNGKKKGGVARFLRKRAAKVGAAFKEGAAAVRSAFGCAGRKDKALLAAVTNSNNEQQQQTTVEMGSACVAASAAPEAGSRLQRRWSNFKTACGQKVDAIGGSFASCLRPCVAI